MILDRYLNPTVLEYGVNVLAFVNPSEVASSRVVFTATGAMPLFTSQGGIAKFTNDNRSPLYGDNL
jgi:hypothetical protein